MYEILNLNKEFKKDYPDNPKGFYFNKSIFDARKQILRACPVEIKAFHGKYLDDVYKLNGNRSFYGARVKKYQMKDGQIYFYKRKNGHSFIVITSRGGLILEEFENKKSYEM